MDSDWRSTRSPTVAEKADRAAYDALFNHYLNNNTLTCSQQRKNGHRMKKAIYNKE